MWACLWAYVFLFQSMVQDFALRIFKFRFSRVHALKAANYSSRVLILFSVSVFKPQTRHVVAAVITDCKAHAWRARRSQWFVSSRVTCILDHIAYAYHILTTLISHCHDILQLGLVSLPSMQGFVQCKLILTFSILTCIYTARYSHENCKDIATDDDYVCTTHYYKVVHRTPHSHFVQMDSS